MKKKYYWIVGIIIIIIAVIGVFALLKITSCNTMNPNYCNTNNDCICSMDLCFMGNKEYAASCVQKANGCEISYCFFAPGENVVCINHTCQIGKV